MRVKIPLMARYGNYCEKTAELDRVISMPMRTEIADKLNRQIEVICRNITEQLYYVIDSHSNLISLTALIETIKPQALY